jgi:hypothetical protein
MSPGEAAMFIVIGFVLTLIAEMVYRMVRAIGKRGDPVTGTT